MNITMANKLQIGNLFRIGIEFEFVPILLGLHTDMYSSSVLNDNCMMIQGEVQVLRLDVILTKHFARCENNLFEKITEANSINDFLSDPLGLLSPTCYFDDTFGPSRQHLDSLSFTLWP